MEPYPTYFNQPGAQATHPEPQEPRGRGARPYTGAKRGRKPRGAGPTMTSSSTRPEQQSQPQPPPQPQPPSQPQSQPQSHPQPQPQLQPGTHAYAIPATPQPLPQLQYYSHQPQQSVMMPPPQYTPLALDKGKGKDDKTSNGPTLNLSTAAQNPSTLTLRYPTHQQQPHPVLALGHGSLSMHGAGQNLMKPPMQMAAAGGPLGGVGQGTGGVAGDDEDDADELPVMSDDVYGQGLLWQSQSKDNLKVLMDNFTPEQFERYEAYRRSALPKQSVRKVVQQSTNYTISQPVAQIVAGFAKVFVGEIVEEAREVQARMGEAPDTPLSPEHLREAYRLYQNKTGKVGAARVHRGKKLFVR